MAKWKADLVADLGGPENVSTQQSALVDLAVKSKLLLDSIDAWLLVQPSLINARKKALLPVVRERQQLFDGLARYLSAPGLQRVAFSGFILVVKPLAINLQSIQRVVT